MRPNREQTDYPLITLETYKARFALENVSTSRTVLFQNQTAVWPDAGVSTQVFNDLGSTGRLPDARAGTIIAMYLAYIRNHYGESASTLPEAAAAFMQVAELELFVAGTLVARGPARHYPNPAAIPFRGSIATGNATDFYTLDPNFSGPPAPFNEQLVNPNEAIQVVVSHQDRTLPTPAAGSFEWEVGLLVNTKRHHKRVVAG